MKKDHKTAKILHGQFTVYKILYDYNIKYHYFDDNSSRKVSEILKNDLYVYV